jgi:dolichyl-phosphate beta-glucosyltransferase
MTIFAKVNISDRTMPKICVVIPFYNEAVRFETEAFHRFKTDVAEISLCLVNDGSTDSTLELLHSLAAKESHILVVDLPHNGGKAEAVRQGMLKAYQWDDFDYFAFLDADFSAPPESVLHLFEQGKGASFTMGSRLMILGANIMRNPFRHYTGRIFATLASETLRLPIYDTQCGAKMLSRDLIPIAFADPFVSTWLFDLEIIMRLIKHFGWNQFKLFSKEVPLKEWIEKGGSKVKLTYMFRLPFDLWKIKKKYGRVS